jgi:DHA1 family tetracycline resistance protein-like MFS transporter
VWAIGAALYLLVLPLLFNSRARSQQDDAVGTSASE